MPSHISELRVERHRGQIDVYQLLGLERWETNPLRIQEAVAAARVLLSQPGKPHDHSQLEGYVTEAEGILTDATRKQRYDISLRQAIEAEIQIERVAEEAPIPTSSESKAVQSASPKPPPAVKQRARDPGEAKVVSVPSARPFAALPSRPARTPIWVTTVEFVKEAISGIATWLLSWWEALHGGSPVRFTLALLFAGGVLVFLLRQFDWNKTFPETTIASRTAGEFSTTAILSPKPAVESIPGQRVGTPRTIPGLEEFEGYAPSLNAGLTQIVFAARNQLSKTRILARKSSDLDLFLAARTRSSDSFQTPKVLAECNSPDNETDPALSPDGLELVFVRNRTSSHAPSMRTLPPTQPDGSSVWTNATSDAVLMRSIRSSLADSFAVPQVIDIPQLPVGQGVLYDSLQLLHDGDLLLRVTDSGPKGSRSVIYLSRRTSRDSDFLAAEELPVFVEQARHFVSSDGKRAFVSRFHTIQLSCRSSADAPFSAPGKLDVLNATRIGSAEGPIWVSPAEDFLFYCVTVTNSSHQQRRYLRQVRIR